MLKLSPQSVNVNTPTLVVESVVENSLMVKVVPTGAQLLSNALSPNAIVPMYCKHNSNSCTGAANDVER